MIHKCFSADLELDTVAYNTFIKAMLEAGLFFYHHSVQVII